MGKPSKDTRTPLPLFVLRRVTLRDFNPSRITVSSWSNQA